MLHGETRTRVKDSHALIAPDGHVQSDLPGWIKSKGVILISPQMGAKFTQYLVLMQAGGQGTPSDDRVERFFYVLSGSIELRIGADVHSLAVGGYAYLPPGQAHTMTADMKSEIVVIERRYVARKKMLPPDPVVGTEEQLEGEPFMGDDSLQLRKMLPEEPNFDMAVNTMTFDPGTPLPQVETHVMEHGLYMLRGSGIYRLADDWYPIQKGDVVWMAPYCPQWFGTMGKQSASYLLYKDVGRDPFAFEKES